MRAQGLVSLFWYMKGGSSTCYIMCTVIDTLAGRTANTKWHPSLHSPFRGKALYLEIWNPDLTKLFFWILRVGTQIYFSMLILANWHSLWLPHAISYASQVIEGSISPWTKHHKTAMVAKGRREKKLECYSCLPSAVKKMLLYTLNMQSVFDKQTASLVLLCIFITKTYLLSVFFISIPSTVTKVGQSAIQYSAMEISAPSSPARSPVSHLSPLF